jgi:DNA polymerase elongation subunit (family B)
MHVYVKKWGNKMFITRYDEKGKKHTDIIKPQVEVFVPTSKKKTEYKVFPTNMNVEKMIFKTINDYKDFKDSGGKGMIYGNLGQYHHELNYIRANAPKTINPNWLKVFSIDIETRKGKNGYSKPNDASEPISTLCIIDKNTGKSVIWGYCTYKRHKETIDYRYFDCEAEMLNNFCQYIGEQNPDVMIGWNTTWYDFPYIWNRLKVVFEENFMTVAKLMSPFHKVVDKQHFNKQRNETAESMDIFGTQLLDLMEIYIKYNASKKSSYKLNDIAEEELGITKLDYSEEGDLESLYLNNPQKYIEYEYRDVKIVHDLMIKKNYINRIFSICHYAKMPVEKFSSPVLMWEALKFNELMDRKMVFPIKKTFDTTDRIEGAFVKDPIPGIYEHFASIDVNSEYPHVIIANNISSETKLHKFPDAITKRIASTITVDKLVNEEIDLQPFIAANICVAANGSIYRKDIKGVGPILMERLYKQRNMHKGEMKTLISDLKAGKFEKSQEAEIKLRIENLDNLQWSEKIILNSFYGAFSNVHFRFYDKEIAEAITLTAQTVIKTAERGINIYMNKVLKTDGVDYIIYVDTDSCYIGCRKLVSIFKKKREAATQSNIIDFIDVFFKKKIEPELKAIFTRMSNYMGCYADCMVMKREIIAESGFWLKKKKYVMKVWDDEGKRYDKAELKMKGVQVVRSDTPKSVKGYLKELISKILDGTSVKKYIKDVKKLIKKMDVNDIAISKSANNLEKYTEISKTGKVWFKKGTPMQVRASILHNIMLDEKELRHLIQPIMSGDKVKMVHLKNPNPLEENIIGFQGNFPTEFELDKYIDKEQQYYKIFGKIADDMCEALGIATKNQLF